MARFANLDELTEYLARETAARVVGAKLGFSNQSCSAYVSIGIDADEDGDFTDEFKVRFSDHGDRHGSNLTLRIDAIAEDILDEDGDFDGVEMSDAWISHLIAEAAAALDRA